MYNLTDLLSSSNKGKHTVFCRIKGPTSKLDAYFFPGTVHKQGQEDFAVAYVPEIGVLGFVCLGVIVDLVKPVKAWLDKNEEVEKLIEQFKFWDGKVQKFCDELREKNMLLAFSLASFVRGISQGFEMNEEVFSSCKQMFDAIEKEMGSRIEINKLRQFLQNYYENSKRQEFLVEASQIIKKAKKESERVPSLQEEDYGRIREELEEQIGEKEVERLGSFVHAMVVVQAMLLGDKQFYTLDELKEKVLEFRPEFKMMDEELTVNGIKDGLKVAEKGLEETGVFPTFPAGLVEYNQIMDVWSLTEEGSVAALSLLKMDQAAEEELS